VTASTSDVFPIVAVATRDPLDHRTFSGFSRHLFNAVQDVGHRVVPIATRDLRWYDALTGAVAPLGLLPGRRGDRRRPVVRPDWYWSRGGFERFGRRFDARLAEQPVPRVVVQIGTHVRSRLPGTTSYCITDATIPQAVRAGEFSVSFASGHVLAEAIECQAEVFASCRKVLVLSEWARSSVLSDYGLPADRVVVLGAGANVERTLPRKVDTARPFILFVGADWKQKGGPLLLEAFRIARLQVPELRLVVVGCAPRLDVPGVEVLGFLSRADPVAHQRLLELYASATCFSIVPPFDAFPNVLLEAALFGVPVISTREGSRPEAVIHGETGLLAERRAPDELAALVLRVVADPQEGARLGEAARRRATSWYTWPLVARRLLAEVAPVGGAE